MTVMIVIMMIVMILLTMAAMVWCIFLCLMLPEVSSTNTTCLGMGARFSGAEKWTK